VRQQFATTARTASRTTTLARVRTTAASLSGNELVRPMTTNSRAAELTLALAIFCFSNSSGTAEPFIYGAGTMSCGDWTEDHKDSLSVKIVAEDSWLEGYITAFGIFLNGQLLNSTTPAGLIEWVSNYCRSKPLDTVGKAASALTLELSQQSVDKIMDDALGQALKEQRK
jgi:hypothetical protein